MTKSRALALVLLCLPLAACDKGPKSGEATAAPASATAPAPTTAPEAPAAAPTASGAAPATAPAGSPAPAGTAFGAGVKLAEVTPIDAILADPKAYQGKTVRVEGMITDVCPKRGCWFDMAGGGPGKKLKFKVTDGEMVFPVDAKGKHAVAEGVVTLRERSIEESKEYAEYQKKEYGIPYDPATITKPTLSVMLAGTGAVFRDQK
ncbi:MAG TPA: DUF4920 domain-containing protein [Kofleriaceae bacterium]|nr:DUF4920 domain-containing protein [Kofleriaceae bacterium]